MIDQLQFSESSIEGIPKLKDQELLKATADLVQRERHVLTLVLHHLREVERRRLFSDLGHPSLFEYCVRELKYSEGQAGRRIQAMRLLKELPEIEPMIRSGSLSLTNLSQAQSYFRDVQKQAIQKQASENQGAQKQTIEESSIDGGLHREQPLSRTRKLEILQSLENTSSREGQKRLIEIEREQVHLGSTPLLPKDRERPLAQGYNQVCFAMSPELKEQLEVARSLLGIAGAQMNLNDLLLEITQIAVRELEGKRFGKKRTVKKYEELEEVQSKNSTPKRDDSAPCSCQTSEGAHLKKGSENRTPAPELDIKCPPGLGFGALQRSSLRLGPTQPQAQSKTEAKPAEDQSAEVSGLGADSSTNPSRTNSANARYISRSVRQAVWDRDGGKCVCCSSMRNLNFDHIQPVALGGESTENNLRLLCFQCNQRQALKTFGIHSGVTPQTQRRHFRHQKVRH